MQTILVFGLYGIAIGRKVWYNKIDRDRALLEPETTYNFEVADYHTYYVGECNVH